MSTELTLALDLGEDVLGEALATLEGFQNDASEGINPLATLPLLKMQKPATNTAKASVFDLILGGESMWDAPKKEVFVVFTAWYGACTLWGPGKIEERKESGDLRPRCFTSFQSFKDFMQRRTSGTFRSHEGYDRDGKIILGEPQEVKCSECRWREFGSDAEWQDKETNRKPAASQNLQVFVTFVEKVGDAKYKNSSIPVYEVQEDGTPYALLNLSFATNMKAWTAFNQIIASKSSFGKVQVPNQALVLKASVATTGGDYNNPLLKLEWAGLLNPHPQAERGINFLRTQVIPGIQEFVMVARKSGVVTSEMGTEDEGIPQVHPDDARRDGGGSEYPADEIPY